MNDNEQHPTQADASSPGLSSRETYHVVSDTVTGVNVRLSDNVIQAIAIFICVLLGAVVGACLVAQARLLGGLAGGFIGMVAGLLGSGVFLMFYRGLRHLRGRHD